MPKLNVHKQGNNQLEIGAMTGMINTRNTVKNARAGSANANGGCTCIYCIYWNGHVLSDLGCLQVESFFEFA